MRTVVLRADDIEVHASPFGATITKIIVPDRDGAEADVVLGYDSLRGYENTAERPYFGAVIGRVANRIANARFTIGDRTYKLAATNGPNTLHGGVKGFDRAWWSTERLPPVVDEGLGEGVRFTYRSKDGEEGFPGNLTATVTYRVAAGVHAGVGDGEQEHKQQRQQPRPRAHDARLLTEMTAVCDAVTPVNLAQHSYFNLRGHDSSTSVFEHRVKLHAAEYTPLDDTLIPTGATAATAGTLFDLYSDAAGTPIGAHPPPGGYDHNFSLVNYKPDQSTGISPVALAAEVSEPITGRCMEVSADVPGVQFYTGNFLNDVRGKGGAVYGRHAGFCLETQHFPDAVNQPAFASCLLKPGQTYRHNMVHRFFTVPR